MYLETWCREPDDHNIYILTVVEISNLRWVLVYMFIQSIIDVLEDGNNKYVITNVRFLLKMCDIRNAVLLLLWSLL